MKRAQQPRVLWLLLFSLVLRANPLFAQTTLTWGGGNAPAGTPAGGAGTWNATNLNWTATNGAMYQAWTAAGTDPAVFAGNGGAVSLGSGINASALTFTTDGYVIGTVGGNALTLVNNFLGFGPSINVANAGQTTTIAAALVGSAQYQNLFVSGKGTLVLKGANTFDGGLNLTSATVKLMTATGALGLQNVNFGSLPSSTGGGGTLILDNTGATAASAVTLGGANYLNGDSTVQLVRTAPQNLSVQFVNGHNRATGATVNYVTGGGTNGTQVSISVAPAGSYVDQGTFFNGSSYAWTDNGGFLRGINYGTDSGTRLSTGGSSVTATTHLKLTGAVTAQATATFTTINLASANNLTLGSSSTVTVSGLLKSGGNAASILAGTLRAATSAHDLVVRTDLATDALTIGSLIANPTTGTGTLTKTGAGTLTLTNTSNSYSGGTFLNAGVLSVAALPTGTGNSAVGAGPLKFSGGTLQYTGATVSTTRGVTFLGGGGAVEVTNSGTNLTLNSAISGANTGAPEDSLVKLGAGTLTLSGSNDNSGLSTVVNAGTLVLGKTSNSNRHATGNLFINGGTAQLGGSGGDQVYDFSNVAVASGGTFDLNGRSEAFDGLGGDGTITNKSTSAASTLTFGIGSGATIPASTFGGVISDGASKTVAVVKGGVLTEIFSGPNTYTGGTTIAGGTLQLGNGGTTGSIAGNVSTTDASAILAFNRSDNPTFAGNISGSGGLAQLGAGTVKLSGTNSYSGVTTVARGTLQFTKTSALYGGATASWTADNLVVNAGATAAFNVGGSGEFTAAHVDTLIALGAASGGFKSGAFIGFDTTNAAGGTFTYNSNITNPNGGLNALGVVKLGAGTLVLGGNNTYSGDTFVNAGTLTINSATAFSPNTHLHVAAGASFYPWTSGPPTTTTIGELSGNGQVNLGGNGSTLEVQPSNGGSSTFQGTLGGDGGLTLNGNGTLVLAPTGAANNYAGPTTITQGTVQLGGAGALPPTTPVQVGGGGTLDLNGNSTTIGQLGGSGSVVLGSAPLTIGQTGTSTFSGTLTGSGAVTLNGDGKLDLSGDNTTFTGPITVSGGTLKLSGSTPNSTITITGGTLSGSGSAGAVTIGAGGHLAPGNSPGTFTAGTITLGSSGPTGGLDWEISNFTGAAGNATTGGWDLLVATSLLDITATSADPFRVYITSLNLSNVAGQAANFDPTHSYTFNFVDAASVNGFAVDKFTLDTSAFTNAFTGTWSIGLSGNTLNLIYTGGGPVSPIPEPSTYALFAGLGMLGWAWRRRRKNAAR